MSSVNDGVAKNPPAVMTLMDRRVYLNTFTFELCSSPQNVYFEARNKNTWLPKGQLVWKCLFVAFNSSKK